MSDPIATQPRPAAGARRRRWGLGAAMAGAFVAGGLAFSGLGAIAQDSGMGAMMAGHRDHAAAMAHMSAELDAVGATADQKSRIATLLHTGLRPMMEAHGGLRDVHGDLMRILTAPTIDRAALEQLRAGEIARLDQASRTAVQAIADAAEVLSPDQRAKLAARIAAHHPPT